MVLIGKILPYSFFIGVLIIFVASSNFPEILSQKTNTISDRTLNRLNNSDIDSQEKPYITVGKNPTAMAIDNEYIYVANSESDTVSVISKENFTKIKDIPVGYNPLDITTDGFWNEYIYVANSESDTVSVISKENFTKIKDIPVGYNPVKLLFNINPNIGILQNPILDDFLYVVNQGSDNVSVISILNNTKIYDIEVGRNPTTIKTAGGRAYVTNYNDDNGTISVFSTYDNSKITDIPVGMLPSDLDFLSLTEIDEKIIFPINNMYLIVFQDTISVVSLDFYSIIADIPVGRDPTAVITDNTRGLIYVTNGKDTYNNNVSGNLSIISATNNTKIKDIPVGNYPIYMETGGPEDEYVYVVNSGSNTVSVISKINHTKIKDIPVGDNPTKAYVDESANSLYVINSGSDSISVIDRSNNTVVSGLVLDTKPFNSGYVECDENLIAPTSNFFFLYSGTICTAKPNKGFEFLSWEQRIGSNATQLVNVSKPATALESILDIFNLKPEKPEATLKVSTFGSFTANFKELPPALPAEYWIPLYGIIASTLVGWSIPSIIGWTRSKGDIRKLNYYHQRIKSLYDDGKLDEKDVEPLDRLKTDIIDAYSKGKLSEKHYERLNKEISMLYENIFRKRIDNLDSNDNNYQGKLQEIKRSIKAAYSEDKLTELHYNLLNEEVSQSEKGNSK